MTDVLTSYSGTPLIGSGNGFPSTIECAAISGTNADVADLTQVDLAATFPNATLVAGDLVCITGRASPGGGHPVGFEHGGLYIVGTIAALTPLTRAPIVYGDGQVVLDVGNGDMERRRFLLVCATPLVLDTSAQAWWILPATSLFGSWAGFTSGYLAFPEHRFQDVGYYVTTAGQQSYWTLVRTTTGIPTAWQWRCLWSAWYQTTAQIAAVVLTEDYVGVRCYDTTAGLHAICQKTGPATYVWTADPPWPVYEPRTWAQLLALTPCIALAGTRVQMLTYVDNAAATQDIGLQGTVDTAGVDPTTLGVLTFTLTIGGTAQLVTFANPATWAAALATINAAIVNFHATAAINSNGRLIVRSEVGAISATSGTLAVATIGFVSGAVHSGGALVMECAQDIAGSYVWRPAGQSEIVSTWATRPAANAWLVGLRFQATDLECRYHCNRDAGAWAWAPTVPSPVGTAGQVARVNAAATAVEWGSSAVGERVAMGVSTTSVGLAANPSSCGQRLWTTAEHFRDNGRLRVLLGVAGAATGSVGLYDLTAAALVQLIGAATSMTTAAVGPTELVSDAIALTTAHYYEVRIWTSNAAQPVTLGVAEFVVA